MPFEFSPTSIAGVLVAQPQVFLDRRGSFMETFDGDAFRSVAPAPTVVQAYYSTSQRGVLRGLHLQASPHEQGKVIQCIMGEVFDVIVDLRPQSPTFRRHVSMNLSEENHLAVYAPPGCAHGFYVTRGPAGVYYLVDKRYEARSEIGVRWDDPELEIPWPVLGEPILSDKDARLPPLSVLIKTGQLNHQRDSVRHVN